MKSILPILFAFAIHSASFAQPTINIGDMTPSIGSTITGADATYTDPGYAGANQTWDLTGMTPEVVSTSTFLSPSGLPESSSFPGATHASFLPIEEVSDFYGYINVGNNQIEELGFYTSGPDVDLLFIYTNPRTIAVFPLSYNDTFSDNYESEMENEVENEGQTGTMLSTQTGTLNAVVDGYGTLITPAGAFSDVLRVRYDIEATNTVSFEGEELFSGESTEIEYQYYKSGFPIPLATLNTTSTLFMGQVVNESTSGGYFMDMSVGLEEYKPLFNNVQVYPMPATTHIELQLNSKSGSISNFMLLSNNGKMVHQWNQQSIHPGLNQLRFELPELPAGTYLLVINNADGMHTERVVVGK